MRCDEFEDRLNTVLDKRQRRQWDAELSLHCDTCAQCGQLAAAYDALLDGFYELTTPEAPHDMGLRVIAQVRTPPSTGRRLALVAAVLATAAALLVVVGPAWRGTPDTPQADPNPNVASTTKPRIEPPFERVPLEGVPPFVPELLAMALSPDGDPYAGLARETGQGLANVILYVPGVGGGKGIIDVEADGTPGEPAWAVRMSEGLKPITDSVTETFNLLLRSFPISQLAARG